MGFSRPGRASGLRQDNYSVAIGWRNHQISDAWRYREIQKGKATDRRSRQHVAKFILVALCTGTRASAVCEAALEPTGRRLGSYTGAQEIIWRAERRLGEMVIHLKNTSGLASGGMPYQGTTGSDLEPVERTPTLNEIGIDKKLSSQAQKLASISERAVGQPWSRLGEG
jgi:hypothetical protein